MTSNEKIIALKLIMGIETDTEDEVLQTYLSMAGQEIISWRFSHFDGEAPCDVPSEYEQTQLFAVVAGYSQSGAENQTRHDENGISRTFKYEDMVAYIRSHVIPYVKIP